MAIYGYRHANHFWQVKLRSTDDEEILLHYWPVASPWSEIHSHQRSFTSQVIFGGLLMEEFVQGDDGVLLPSYSCRRTEDRYVFEEREKACLARSAAFYHTSCVRRPFDVIHRVRATTETLTKVVRGPVESHSVVYTDDNRPGGTFLPLTEDEIGWVLRLAEGDRQVSNLRPPGPHPGALTI